MVFYKIEKSIFRPNNARYEKKLTSKIVHFKEIYNFDFEHFLIKRTVFVLIVKNIIKNQKFNFSLYLGRMCASFAPIHRSKVKHLCIGKAAHTPSVTAGAKTFLICTDT